jgi:DedD protein
MRLPFLRPKEPASPKARAATGADGAATVEAARTRARRRLIGALVLLAVGVVGFPVLFETQPRPLSPDTPFELPRPPATPPTAPVVAPAPLPPADAGIEAGPAASAASAVAVAASAPAAAPDTVPGPVVAAAAPASGPRAAASAARPDDGRRALSLLAGDAASAAAGARYIVQVGAYADASVLREARLKVERLGLKTYTQVIEGDAGKRTRVRVGPYATKDEASAAASKIKAAGLPGVVLTL